MVQRVTIGVFGPRNAGKSSLVNLIVGQQVSIVSDVAGTTTDPVSKPIEINGLGACVFIDTPGYDDGGKLGTMRVSRTKQTIARCEIALFVIPTTMTNDELREAHRWYMLISERVPQTMVVINRFASAVSNDFLTRYDKVFPSIEYVAVDITDASSRDVLLMSLGFVRERISDDLTIVTHLVQPYDVVLLVMPQDIQAPAGRLILPQVQTIRELLDYRCTVISCTVESFSSTICALCRPISLIVCDSQIFDIINAQRPYGVRLTSFSVLFARWKGDIDTFISGANTISKLTDKSRVLIAEACTHAPLAEDIGREKIPSMLRRVAGEGLTIDICSGNDWPENLSQYDLVVHCGACMLGRQQVLSRLSDLSQCHVPVTNYGVAIAYLKGILNKIVY